MLDCMSLLPLSLIPFLLTGWSNGMPQTCQNGLPEHGQSRSSRFRRRGHSLGRRGRCGCRCFGATWRLKPLNRLIHVLMDVTMRTRGSSCTLLSWMPGSRPTHSLASRQRSLQSEPQWVCAQLCTGACFRSRYNIQHLSARREKQLSR